MLLGQVLLRNYEGGRSFVADPTAAWGSIIN